VEPEPGAVLADRYHLDKLLGEGGFGTVWAATHSGTGKTVAIKLLKTAGNPDVLRRFRREAKAVSAVNHPNVVSVHDIFDLPDGTPVMVMDLLAGRDLGARLQAAGRLDLAETSRILTPILSAVGAAHAAGIVHRDLKPDNIFLHVRGDGEAEPKVLDFGIAKLTGREQDAMRSAHLTQTGAVLGTPYYMSPEQVFGERDLDHRADVWAMGVIIYECLSGTRPYDGENFGQLFRAITVGQCVPLNDLVPHLPLEVTDLVAKMLQPDRARRLPDLSPAFELLRKYGAGRRTEPPPAFGSPAVPAFTPGAQTPLSQPGSEGGRHAEVGADSTGEARPETRDGFSRTGPAVPQRRRGIVRRAFAGAAAVGVLGFGTFALRSSLVDEATSGSAASSNEPIQSESIAAQAASERSAAMADPAAPRVEIAPDASTSATKKSAAEPRAVGATSPTARSQPKSAKPAAPTAPVVSATTAPITTSTKLPGNVVGEAPF
jgi:hypothetical protein